MLRKIVNIDEEKCNGCGACAAACHEGAIGMVNGKAKLLRDDYCDGLGDCLPACPTGAISFTVREAAEYDEAAVKAAQAKKAAQTKKAQEYHTCPGTLSRKIEHSIASPGRLANFPVQLKLVPVKGDVFDGADLLIAADCVAYAYGDFHNRFIKGRTTVIGCPKLDDIDYSEKLTEIIKNNSIRSITLVRMQVPCCGGLARALETAVERSGKDIPVEVYIIAPNGEIVG